MKRSLPFFWLFLAVVVQGSLLKQLGFHGAFLNLTLVILLLSVFEKSQYRRIILGAFFSGWLLGGLSGLPFGSLALVMIISALLFDRFLFLLPRDSFAHFIILVAGGTLIYNGVLIFVLSAMRLAGLAEYSLTLSLAWAGGVALEVVYNLIGAATLYPLRKWIIL